jgi:hypothetical protein
MTFSAKGRQAAGGEEGPGAGTPIPWYFVPQNEDFAKGWHVSDVKLAPADAGAKTLTLILRYVIPREIASSLWRTRVS